MKHWILAILTLCVTTGCTHPFGNVYDNTPAGNMEALWSIIDEKYCFLEEKDVDWEVLKQPYIDSAKLLAPGDKLALFDLMERMINRLEDGHVNLYTSFDRSQCVSWYKGYPENYDERLINELYINNSRYAGGMYYQRIADDAIGYIYCGAFEIGASSANMYYILTAFRDCKGIVLDVRNNGGGSLEYAYTLASTFFDHDTTIGYWQHKTGKRHSDFSELKPIKIKKDDMPSKWLRPVIVLQNRHTYSAANSFVNAMRYGRNVLLLGGMSGGGGGMPLSYELPNGWLIRFSSIRMYDADHKSIEGGIAPHVYETLRSTDKDDLIEHAVQLINKAYE